MNVQQHAKPRIQSIDLLRGLVMVIMALDHTRDFFHIYAMNQDPLNLATTSPALFLTRWVTHFCAPVFVFLSGSSAYMQGLRKNKKELSLFLIKRGFSLIVVEVVLFNFSFGFDPSFHLIALQTLWSIGMSMIILGLMIWLPFSAILISGLVIVLGHNLLDLYQQKNPVPSLWYSMLHQPGLFPLGKDRNLFVLYPFLPWSGLMMLGYCLGKIMIMTDTAKRKKIFMWLGIGVILFFIVVRMVNVYGDPLLWSKQKNMLYTVFSFINTLKYPPSLLYICMTIGPALLFLAFYNQAKGKLVNIISVFGRVPLFYFIVHFYLIHLLAMVVFFARGHSFAEGTKNTLLVPNFVIPGEGFGLLIVYLIWIAVVVAMYPLCKWYDKYKRDHREKWWLSYF